MALRVLLADESSTIKKVMQLALQDFGVEVKSVPIGLDVMQVCRSFQPDIIFVDILLAKKNGYEVSAELKSDPTLKRIPIVMMWSGFMELDEKKAREAQIDQRLEKPFDADTLREMVKTLVPKLNSNMISQFLTFPEMPEFQEPEPAPQGERLKTKTLLEHTESLEEPTDMDDLDEPEEFQRVPLPKNREPQKPLTTGPRSAAPGSISPSARSPRSPQAPAPTPRDEWQDKDLSRFKLEIPAEENYNEIDAGDLTQSAIALSSGVDEIHIDDIDNPEPQPIRRNPPRSSAREQMPISTNMTSAPLMPSTQMIPSMPSIDPVRAEEILRAEAKIVLENIAWKIIPDIVERVVREELHKLMRDAERL